MEPAFMTKTALMKSCKSAAISWQRAAAAHHQSARDYMDHGYIYLAKYNQSAARACYNNAARFMARLGIGVMQQ